MTAMNIQIEKYAEINRVNLPLSGTDALTTPINTTGLFSLLGLTMLFVL